VLVVRVATNMLQSPKSDPKGVNAGQ